MPQIDSPKRLLAFSVPSQAFGYADRAVPHDIPAEFARLKDEAVYTQGSSWMRSKATGYCLKARTGPYCADSFDVEAAILWRTRRPFAPDHMFAMFVVFDRLLVSATFIVVGCPGLLRAQFTDPRNYSNSPVGINQLTLGYAFAHANASVDPSLVIAGAKLNLDVGILDYTRNVSFFHRFAWVEASVPIAGLNGAVTGTTIQGSVTGAGDSTYVFGTLLKGGPALSVQEFPKYEPRTTLGVSVTMTAPTGLYDANRILNIGSDRWSFKPEMAVSHPFGPNHNWV